MEAVIFKRTWQGDRRRYYAMRYSVPRDLSEREANAAIRHGVAVEDKPATDKVSLRRGATARRGSSRKAPAPENKALTETGEHQPTLV